MQKLSKADVTRRDALMLDTQQAWETLAEAVDDFNTAMQDAWQTLERVQEAYNTARGELMAWLGECATDMEQYFDERSEKWQRSDAGQAYEGWMEPYRDTQLLEESVLECPEPLILEVDEPNNAFGQLADEPD